MRHTLFLKTVIPKPYHVHISIWKDTHRVFNVIYGGFKEIEGKNKKKKD
jgi:hypothetical protein